MIVKVEVLPRRDRRVRKQVIVTNIERKVLFQGEHTEIVKKLDGSYKSYFLATVKQDPNNLNKNIVELDARLQPQKW